MNYNPIDPPEFPNRFGYQNWNGSGDYTSLFINLVDDFNEMGQDLDINPLNEILGVINDQVSGYTLANIESNMLGQVYGIGSLSAQLKANKPTGVTDAQIDLLLGQY